MFDDNTDFNYADNATIEIWVNGNDDVFETDHQVEEEATFEIFTRVEPMSSRQAMMSYGLYDDSTPGLSKGFVVESFVGCP